MSAEDREEVMRILNEARDDMRLLEERATQSMRLMDELVAVGVLSKDIQTFANDLATGAEALVFDLEQRLRILRGVVKESELFTSANTD